MRHFSVFSTYLVNIFGKERIETAIGIMGVVFLLAFLSTSAYIGVDLLGLSPRLSQNTATGRGCPAHTFGAHASAGPPDTPPGPSPEWRCPMESRFTLLA